MDEPTRSSSLLSVALPFAALVALLVGVGLATVPLFVAPAPVPSPTATPTASAAERRFLAIVRGAYPELASESDGSLEHSGRLACRIFSEGGLWSDVLAELATGPTASQARDTAIVVEGTSDFCPQYAGLVKVPGD